LFSSVLLPSRLNISLGRVALNFFDDGGRVCGEFFRLPAPDLFSPRKFSPTQSIRRFYTEGAFENSFSFGPSLLVDRSYFFSPAFKIILLIFGGGIESTTVYPFGRGNATTTVYFSSPVVSLFSISAPLGSLISLTVARRSTFSLGYQLSLAGKFEVGRQKLPVIPPEVGRLTSRP